MRDGGDRPGPDDAAAADFEDRAETVDEALERVTRELGGIDQRPVTGGRELVAGGQPFAVVGTGLLEVQLDPAIAAAALGTPGVAPGGRGRGWVRFTPPGDSRSRLDVDRAVAWLRLAHRRAQAAR